MKQIKVIDKNSKYDAIFRFVTVTNRVCFCGKKFAYTGKNGQVDNKCCILCQFWVDTIVADHRWGDGIIVDRQHYRLTSGMDFNFGGQKFKVTYPDGREIVTMLSGQGTIPDYLLTVKDMHGNILPNPVFEDNVELALA